MPKSMSQKLFLKKALKQTRSELTKLVRNKMKIMNWSKMKSSGRMKMTTPIKLRMKNWKHKNGCGTLKNCYLKHTRSLEPSKT
jgi:hypothetical protein